MKTQIIKLLNDWKHVKNVSRTTVNKGYSDVEATKAFKQKMLISEHSPIREIIVKWKWENIKSWVATHYSRHKYECYISTQRSDRTGVDRDSSRQDTLVNMDNTANAQQLIDVARKRLCYCSAKETREYMEDLKVQLLEQESELGEVLVPNCIYRMACPEFEKCGHFDVFLDHNPDVNMYDIQARYDAYNATFYGK